MTVDDWHRAGGSALPEIVSTLLTPAVTRSLPPGWQGAYDLDRAAGWITERDGEGTTLLVRTLTPDMAVGLMLLYEEPTDERPLVDVRLGYLLAEEAWGRGLGGELVGGFVDWAKAQPHVRSLIGGVAADNAASIRILERNGFDRVADGTASDGSNTDGELEYRLAL